MAKMFLLDLEDTGMVGSIKGQKIYLYGDNDTGKALPNYSLIPTPNGYKTVGSIKVGDYLFDRNGKPTKVLKVFPQGKKEVWEVELKDGRKVQCCDEHLWTVYNSHGKLVTKTLKDINEVISETNPYSIPLCKPADYEEKQFSIPPYVLGCILGDGSFRSKCLEYSSATDELPSKIALSMGWEYKKTCDSNYTYVFYDKNNKRITVDNLLQNELSGLVLKYSYEKYIPDIYLQGSIEQRLALLNGLLDTDGNVNVRGGITYSTTSPLLRDEIIELCFSLGMKATWSEDSREKYSHSCYSVNICCPLEMKSELFTLDKHKKRLDEWFFNSKKLNKNNSNTIKHIRSLNFETEMTCFLVDNEEHLFLANDYVVTHNTFQSMKLPKPLLLMAEAGGNGVRGKKYPVTKWSVFKDLVSQLTSEKMTKIGGSDDEEDNEEDEKTSKVNRVPMYQVMQEKFQTIVIDTVENLVELAEQATCQEFNVRDLSEITGKQNGYAIYRKDFKTQINKLCSYGYTVVFIGHEETVEKEDEFTGEKYSFTQPKGTDNVKASTRFVRDLCDFCMFLKPNGIDENGDNIPSTAICKRTHSVFARSRYAIQTFIKPFSAKNLEDAIIKAIEKSAENEGAVLSDWQMKNDDYTREDWQESIKPYFQAVHKKYPEVVKDIVATELGEGVKVSEATDDQLTELENIYNQLVTFSCDQGIVVDV